MKFSFSNTPQKRHTSFLHGLLAPTLVFLFIFLLFCYGISSLSASGEKQEQSSAEESIRRSAIHCYATEGFYPPSLDYIEQHYGLILNRSRFTYVYDIIGDNIMPLIRVIPLKQPPA